MPVTEREEERDVESQYDYFGARYYDARIGRWLVVDPLGGKSPLSSWSPFNYCYDNPLLYIDLKGLAPGDPWIVRQMRASLGIGEKSDQNSSEGTTSSPEVDAGVEKGLEQYRNATSQLDALQTYARVKTEECAGLMDEGSEYTFWGGVALSAMSAFFPQAAIAAWGTRLLTTSMALDAGSLGLKVTNYLVLRGSGDEARTQFGVVAGAVAGGRTTKWLSGEYVRVAGPKIHNVAFRLVNGRFAPNWYGYGVSANATLAGETLAKLLQPVKCHGVNP